MGTQRTLARRAVIDAAPTARLAAFSVYTVDVPVPGRRRRRVFHWRLDHRRSSGRERCVQRWTELVGGADEHAVGAVTLRNLREVSAVGCAVGLKQAAELPAVTPAGAG